MSSTKYADEGSIAHVLAAMCLTEDQNAAAYIGRLIECEDYEHAKLSPSGSKKWMACAGSHALEHADAGDFEPRFFSMEVTEAMAEGVQVYIDAVRARVGEYKLAGAVEVILLVEQKLPIGHITGEEGATGTGDVVIIAVFEDGTAVCDVGDLKFGMGVEVSAYQNPQLMIYGLGALEEYGLLYEFTRVRLNIYQPRLRIEPSEWELSVEELQQFGETARTAAGRAHSAVEYFAKWGEVHDKYLQPGEHCSSNFCKVRATCPKLAAFVEEGVGADFEVIADPITPISRDALLELVDIVNEDLGVKMDAVDIIEDWCKAVRAEVERRLLAGAEVPSPNGGYKLVRGRKGNRDWVDEKEAEKTMKSFRLKHNQMFEYSLISPTTAEKIAPKYDKDGNLKPDQPETPIKPKQWTKLRELITQSEGKPHVAPMSDKRPALVITPVVDDFDTVEEHIYDDLAG